MKKSGYILTFLYIIATAAVLWFAFSVVKGRYFGSGQKGTDQKTETQSQPADQNGNPQNSGQDGVSPDAASSGETPAPEGTHLFVAPADCDNDCARFKDNEENFKYCQEVCGDIAPEEKNSEEDCANLEGLEKDYCFRDLAVSKQSTAICGKIGDTKLRSVCRNRVVEDLLGN